MTPQQIQKLSQELTDYMMGVEDPQAPWVVAEIISLVKKVEDEHLQETV